MEKQKLPPTNETREMDESFNERMHLLTFLKLMEPGWFMRIMVLGCQGEEAFITYTGAIGEIDAGELPGWDNVTAPEIAVEYWKMRAGHHTMRDLIMYIRGDEAKHREVNHTLSNLNQAADPNPYQIEYDDPGKPHPAKSLQNLRGMGWDMNDIFR
ncbi:alternative oxidase-domain-containing protein [Aspergillus novoparasiticus]|uniref:Alternative oxidase n=1 Tax=Aspergillus novoparasiticus TaxID=986946 RepID=A0A5N6F724_9EURO|nr:alternative oxidase-domain-containing protein [Aspergillus novoparasiticus]